MADDDEHSIKHGLTADDRAALVARHFEVAALRQIESELNFARALGLGEALRRLSTR